MSFTECASDTMPPPIRVERPKMWNACDHCRQRKLRCDGQTPSCSNCALYEKTCNYVQGRNKSGPPKGFKRKKAGDSDSRSAEEAPRQKRRMSSPSRTQLAAPSLPSPQQSAQTQSAQTSYARTDSDTSSSRDTSPASDRSFQSNSLPSTSNWVTTVSVPPSGSQGYPFYSNPLPPPYNDTNLAMDPIFLSLFSNPNAVLDNPFAQLDHTSAFYDNTRPPSPQGLTHINLVPQSFQAREMQQPSPAITVPDSYRLGPGVLAAHAFVPLFSLPFLQQILSFCSTNRYASIHAAFFVNAFESLAASTLLSLGASDSPQAYRAAQNQAMQAYFTVLSQQAPPSSSPTCSSSSSYPDMQQTYASPPAAPLIDDATLTAAAMLYLVARSVFTAPSPPKESATWLRLARDMVDAPSFPPARKRWFARVGWLWGRGIVGLGLRCSQIGVGVVGIPEATAGHTSDGEMDDYQREFDGLVSLVLDLESLLAEAKVQTGDVHADMGGLACHVNVPLCLRVREWIQNSPLAQEALLQFAMGVELDAMQDDSHMSLRETIGRVLHLIYYGMAIKFDLYDPVRCSLRRTSMHVAITRIVDASDWLVSTGRTWLWAFALPALLVARDYLYDHCGLPPSTIWSSPSSDDIILSSSTAYASALTSPVASGISALPMSSSPMTAIPAQGPSQANPAFGFLPSSSSYVQPIPPPNPCTPTPGPGDITLLTLVQDVLSDACRLLKPSHRTTAAAAASEIAWVLESFAAAQRARSRDLRASHGREWPMEEQGAPNMVGVYAIGMPQGTSSSVAVF